MNHYYLCSLEFNIHQLILSDLAASVGASKDDPADPTIHSSIDLITSNVTTRAIPKDSINGSSLDTSLEQRVFMVCVPCIVWRDTHRPSQSASRARCNIGFAELSVNISATLLQDTVPVLLDILRDVPYIDFDMNLTWDGELLALVPPLNIRTNFLSRLVFT